MKITAKRQNMSNHGPDGEQLRDEEAEALFDIILKDPDTEIGMPDSNGNQPIFYKGEIIGMLNPSKGYGAIDPDAYAALSGDLEIEKDPEISDSVMSAKSIKASDEIKSKSDLAYALSDILTPELCVDVVNQAFSEYDEFSDDAFTYAGGKDDSFFESLNDETPRNIAYMFFEGQDLDSKGPANPDRDYFRFTKKGNIESTDKPGDVYMDTIKDDIVDFVIDHMDEIEFDEKIQELINEYFENNVR